MSTLGYALNAGNASIAIDDTLRHAARWHDWGKSHPAFEVKLIADHIDIAKKQGVLPSPPESEPVAKAPQAAWTKSRMPRKPTPEDPRRCHFRHELASALCMLHPTSGFPLEPGPTRDLPAYLVAGHHGKVRLSIRSLPDEWIPPSDPAHPADRRFARGVWDSDTLPACDLGGGVRAPSLTLSLEPMELGLCEAEPFSGQFSWAERALHLRDALGPFRLAYLETLLRAADGRASANAGKPVLPSPTVAQAASLCSFPDRQTACPTSFYHLELPGCTPEPLMNYLKALGVFRLVSQQADPHCRGAWRDGQLVLTTTLDRDKLLEFFIKHYQPSPFFSPWNGDGGFLTETGSSFEIIQAIRTSTNPRLAPLRDAIRHIETMTILKEFGQCRAQAKALEKKKKAKTATDAELDQLKDLTKRVKELKETILYRNCSGSPTMGPSVTEE